MEIRINNPSNKSKIAIVVVGYNRLKSITRLLNSLLIGNYPSNDIPLVISIDSSNNKELYDYVRDFKWPFGEKHLIKHEKRLGLKDHIFSCGDLTQYFKAIILLEDDLYVSSEFYNYTTAMVEKYNNTEQVAGISLYSIEFNGFAGFPFTPLNNGSDVFAVQTVISWGQCWTTNMWKGFKKWLSNNKINFIDYDMPQRIKTWERAWSKYFYAYILATDKYFILPYISLSTNCGDAGVHGDGSSSDWQVNLLNGPMKYTLNEFENLVKYDVYFNNAELSEILKINKNELCTDLYGNNHNFLNKRYWLSIKKLPYKIINKYALSFRPPEMNIIKKIEGNDIFLYDTTVMSSVPKVNSLKFVHYHLRSYKRSVLLKYSLITTLNAIKKKIFYIKQ